MPPQKTTWYSCKNPFGQWIWDSYFCLLTLIKLIEHQISVLVSKSLLSSQVHSPTVACILANTLRVRTMPKGRLISLCFLYLGFEVFQVLTVLTASDTLNKRLLNIWSSFTVLRQKAVLFQVSSLISEANFQGSYV